MTTPDEPGDPVSSPASRAISPIGIAVTLVAILVLCVACGGLAGYFRSSPPDPTGQAIADLLDEFERGKTPADRLPAGDSRVVRYELLGTGEATISWSGVDGATVTALESLPWAVDVMLAGDVTEVQVLAYGDGIEGCRILVDGVELTRSPGIHSGTNALCRLTG